MSILEIDVATGREKPLIAKTWSRVGRVVWTKDLNKLFITATDFGSDLYQIIKITRASEKTTNITVEGSNYYNISLNKDSNRLLATTHDKSLSISTAPLTQINQLKLITSGSLDGASGAVWTSDGRIVFGSMESGNPDVWVMNADGTQRQRLTFDKSADDSPVVSKDGQHIVFVSSRTGTEHLWRTNFSGGDLQQLTGKGGESFPQITPDSKFVIFSARTDGRPTLWKVPIEGGEPVQLTKEMTHWSAVSPDGKMVACLTRGEKPADRFKLAVVSADDGSFLRTFNFSGDASPQLPPTIRWTPDGQAIAYVDTENGVSNIFSQPLADGEPKKLTEFSADRIFSFDFSSDGKSVVFARGVMRNNLVLIENF
jgi:Tol biopolymer transport system component